MNPSVKSPQATDEHSPMVKPRPTRAAPVRHRVLLLTSVLPWAALATDRWATERAER
ncbi:hypothetical protein [Agromyces seonyuensis]|uniref:Uncharacterized protein n=1 Tax=Agromyces seonyuensis TaxID=2662446 RepID=A0A6I4NSV2_9MICO|nr:hypothetical protein [Agromyces seonyuensis]MWB97536.1 hypothetical protein [Agromyces seonyuensis]